MQPDETTSDLDHTTPRASLLSFLNDDAPLARISCNTKYAFALNQIDRIDISDTYDRQEDGVTMYLLDVYLLCVQTGIPTATRVPPPSKCRHKWYRPTKSDSEEDGWKDPLLRKREREKTPHYRIAYRFSEIVALRMHLREIATAPREETLHSKWCVPCRRLYWMATESPFPSRCVPVLDALVANNAWLKRWRTQRRKRKLTQFLQEIVHGARSMQYSISGDQCDGFLSTAFVLKEFLAEPQMSQSMVGW